MYTLMQVEAIPINERRNDMGSDYHMQEIAKWETIAGVEVDNSAHIGDVVSDHGGRTHNGQRHIVYE